MADELHYRKLLATLSALVGKSEAEQRSKGLGVIELYDLVREVERELMQPGKAA